MQEIYFDAKKIVKTWTIFKSNKSKNAISGA